MSREIRELPTAGLPHGRITRTGTGVPRRVRVTGMQGAEVTVVVTVVRGAVWMSISPPFTWEAIMEPGNVDEVVAVLERARDEAKIATLRRCAP
ncbi:MAG: hypothetical protein ACRDRX_21950 [Pseudonocardiaceae bacterium]